MVSIPDHPRLNILSRASGVGEIFRVNFIQHIKLISIENCINTKFNMKNPILIFVEMDFWWILRVKENRKEREVQRKAD
jgi:hypothetical protein